MKLLNGPTIPTPFGGSIKLPDIESPPISRPIVPDQRGLKAIGHGLGEDGAFLVGLIPWIGDYAATALTSLHESEIKKILKPEEHNRYMDYNKTFPSTVALARIFCFKEIAKETSIFMSPQEGPPLPRTLGLKWPWNK